MISEFEQLNLQERELYEGLGVDGRTILELTSSNMYQYEELS